jgi:hypothetical protein
VSGTERERKSASDVVRERAALREVLPAVVALVVVQSSLLMLDPDGGASAWNVVWSMLPMGPAVWFVWAQVRALRRADEYQRLVQLEALAIGFATVILLSMAGGLLDGAGIGDPAQSLQVTFIGGTLAWVVASAVVGRRGR